MLEVKLIGSILLMALVLRIDSIYYKRNPTTDEQVKAFERDGVVLVRRVLSFSEVATLRIAIDEIFRDRSIRAGFFDLTEVAAACRDDGEEIPCDPRINAGQVKGRFLLDTGAWMRSNSIRNIALNSHIPKLCGLLMKSRTINFYDDQVLVKEPLSSEITAFHQNLPYFHVQGQKICAAWAPVDSVTEFSRGLVYVRGSHRWNREYAANIFGSQRPRPGAVGESLPNIATIADRSELLSFDLNLGDIVVHDARTIHGAGGNASGEKS